MNPRVSRVRRQNRALFLSFQRGLCCFPGFSNTSTAPRKGKISKPLLSGVNGCGSPYDGGFSLLGYDTARYDSDRPEEIMLLEKQGRSSQQQRMPPDESMGSENMHLDSVHSRDRSGSLPPSSLPRPPRLSKPIPSKRIGEYGRLSDSEIRKKAEKEQTLRAPRSLIPPPKRLGQYGRLPDGASTPPNETTRILRKPSSRFSNNSGNDMHAMMAQVKNSRDSGSTISDHSASSLPPPARAIMPKVRRGGSLTRDHKESQKYRIQL